MTPRTWHYENHSALELSDTNCSATTTAGNQGIEVLGRGVTSGHHVLEVLQTKLRFRNRKARIDYSNAFLAKMYHNMGNKSVLIAPRSESENHFIAIIGDQYLRAIHQKFYSKKVFIWKILCDLWETRLTIDSFHCVPNGRRIVKSETNSTIFSTPLQSTKYQPIINSHFLTMFWQKIVINHIFNEF